MEKKESKKEENHKNETKNKKEESNNKKEESKKDISLDVATKTKNQKATIKKTKKPKKGQEPKPSVEEELDVSRFDPSKILLQNDENASLEESVAPFRLNKRRRNENAESFESYLRADNGTYKPNKNYMQNSLNEPRQSRTSVVSGYEVQNDQNYDPLSRENKNDPFYHERRQADDPREKRFFVGQSEKNKKTRFNNQ